MQIHPAILVDNQDDYLTQMKAAEGFTTEVDVDIIDWSRSANKTIGVNTAIDIDTSLAVNFDLMMDHPAEVLDEILDYDKTKRVIINVASHDNLSDLVHRIKDAGNLPAISINELSDLEKIESLLNLLDMVQIFTIVPGKQGNPFMVDHLEAVHKLEELKFMGLVGVDGGVNKGTLMEVCRFPVDIASVGSAISKAGDPEQAYFELVGIAHSLLNYNIEKNNND